VYLALVGHEAGASRDLFPAQVDSGADVTVLPAAIIEALRLPVSGLVRAVGFGGVEDDRPVYRVELSVRGVGRVVSVEALASDSLGYALLGLDALSRHRVVLDGPALALDIE
jgi:hypothetical protein